VIGLVRLPSRPDIASTSSASSAHTLSARRTTQTTTGRHPHRRAPPSNARRRGGGPLVSLSLLQPLNPLPHPVGVLRDPFPHRTSPSFTGSATGAAAPAPRRPPSPVFSMGCLEPGMGRPDVARCGHGLRTKRQQAAPGPVRKWPPEIRPVTVYSIFDFFFLVNNSRNLVKVLKSMENFRSVKKFQIKFLGILKSRPA
jgi:hypothetical protein